MFPNSLRRFRPSHDAGVDGYDLSLKIVIYGVDRDRAIVAWLIEREDERSDWEYPCP